MILCLLYTVFTRSPYGGVAGPWRSQKPLVTPRLYPAIREDPRCVAHPAVSKTRAE
jgi:hypothetical protein